MIVIYVVFTYLSLGILFSIPFLFKWIHTLDEATRGAGVTFKLTILPGCIIFWPVLLQKYWKSKSARS